MRCSTEKLVVVGQGYVGLPLALRAAEVGFSVVGYDADETRIKRLATGDSYVEDVSATALLAALGTKRYEPTTDPQRCAGFDVAVIAVPTPLADGVPDLSHVEEAARLLGGRLRAGGTVIL
ncbi:MAG TPA: nucleotide sugar dehydrogenase, partial [Acidimicrobiales bacterium]|nr:nucleotide sugar dehydrogenase [Acidimicrobiales bacterium]